MTGRPRQTFRARYAHTDAHARARTACDNPSTETQRWTLLGGTPGPFFHGLSCWLALSPATFGTRYGAFGDAMENAEPEPTNAQLAQEIARLHSANLSLAEQLRQLLADRQSDASRPPAPRVLQKLAFRDSATFDKDDAAKLRPEFFLQTVEDQLTLAGASEDEGLMAASQFLRGVSLTWWQLLRNSADKPTTWVAFKQAFLEHATDAGTDTRRRSTYDNCRQRKTESFTDFATRFREAWTLHPTPPSDKEAAFHLRDGLQEEIKTAVRAEVAAGRLSTVAELVRFGEAWQAERDAEATQSRRHQDKAPNPRPPNVSVPTAMDVGATSTRATAEKEAILNKLSAQTTTLTHLRKGEALKQLSQPQRKLCRDAGICTRCRIGFHAREACPHANEIDRLMNAIKGKGKAAGAAANPKA